MFSVIVTIVLIYWGIRLLVWIFRKVSSAGGGGGASASSSANAGAGGDTGLQLKCLKEIFTTESGQKLDIAKVKVAGQLIIGKENVNTKFTVRLVDITDTQESPSPVACLVESMADKNGIFIFEQELKIPHASSTISDLELCVIPSFALVCPKRGERCIRVILLIADASDEKRVFGVAEISFNHTQKQVGYLERKQHREDQEKWVASVALAMCISDGAISKEELAVVKSFFTERLKDDEDAAARKVRMTEHLRTTIIELKSSPARPREVMERACASIVGDDDAGLAQTTYELAVKTVAGDGAVGDEEQAALERLATRLKLDKEYVRETRDRILTASMFVFSSDEAFLGMPPNLSVDEKALFLAEEYRKWNSRVTSPDPKKVNEANLRIQAITRVKTAMGNVR